MIVAVDFDGTIVKNEYPAIENPNEELIAWIKANRIGNTFILWTCRHGKELDEAVAWLHEQGIVFDYVNENVPELIEKYGDCRKVYADVYIDDACLLGTYSKSYMKGYERALKDISSAMYHECFEVDQSEDMQKWDSGNWFRYKLFENVMEKLKEGEQNG